MPVYRLVPKSDGLTSVKWGGSRLREACWVSCESEAGARRLVEITTLFFGQKDGAGLHSPWLDPSLTDCWPERPAAGDTRRQVPEGAVVTASGRIYR